MKDTYIYPAIFYDDPDGVSVEFPDLPGCLPCARSMEEAFKNAKEALQLHLYGLEEAGETIPLPSPVSAIKPTDGNGVTVMIETWMKPFREKMLNQSTVKTVTIPHWLDVLASREKVNYSRLLQESLKKYLGVKDESALPTQ